MQTISSLELLALGIFLVSAIRSILELLVIPRWYERTSAELRGSDLNDLIRKKRKFEGDLAKLFTVGLMLITAATLFISFTSKDVTNSEIDEIREQIAVLSDQLEDVSADREDATNE